MHPVKGDEDALWTHRVNLKQMVQQKGPLSLWVPLPKDGDTISLVVWLCSHKPALTCLQNVAKHHASMHHAYMRMKPDGTEEEFSRVYIGATRLLLQEKYPGKPIKPMRLPCRRYDAVIFNSLFVHCGTDELGLRAFACLTLKVIFKAY